MFSTEPGEAAGGGVRGGRSDTLRVLGQRHFRLLFLANLASLVGSQISRIGLLLYVFRQDGTVLGVAALVAVETLPGALAAPWAGVLVDRVDKRWVLFGADLVRAALVLGILVSPTLPVVLPLMALHSVATLCFQAAKGAALPLVVEDRWLPAANGVDQSASNAVFIFGPLAGVLLLESFGLGATLAVDAATFLVSAALVVGVRIRRASAGEAAEGASAETWRDIREGWRYLRRQPRILTLNLLVFVALLCTGLWTPLAPFFLREHLGVADSVLGWQIALFGCGSVVGGLLAPRLVAPWGHGRMVLAALAAEGVTMCVYSLVPNVVLSTATLFVWGVAVSMVAVPFYSLSQRLVEERFLGRVFAVTRQAESCALVLAVVFAIWLQQSWPSPRILLVAGLCYVAVTGLSSLTRAGRELLATP